MDALGGLFELIQLDFYKPLVDLFNYSDFIQEFLIKIDVFIGSIFGTSDLITSNFLASIICVVVLWWAISFAFKIFIYAFNFVRSSFLSIFKTEKTTTWRRQWKRK